MLDVLKIVAEKGFLDTSWDGLTFTETPALSVALVEIGATDQAQRPILAFVRYTPGARIPPHWHASDYCSIVVDGEIEITRRRHGPGSIRLVKAGTAYGPLVVGPSGCRVIDVFADHTGIAATFLGTSDLTAMSPTAMSPTATSPTAMSPKQGATT